MSMDERPRAGVVAARGIHRSIDLVPLLTCAFMMVTGCAQGARTKPAADAIPTAYASTPDASPSVSPTPSDPPTTAAALPRPTPSRTVAKPTAGAVKPAVTPSKRELNEVLPNIGRGQAPPCPPTYTGPSVDRATVRAALDAAADMRFWVKSAPALGVPRNLVYAIAWQESGWQSTIMACDGGIGTMQVMPGTVDLVKDNFARTFDATTLSGNTMGGVAYLEWLVRKLGDEYFGGSYDLTVPAIPGGVSLLDSVISGYNMGIGKVTPTLGPAGILNPRYVQSVKALMTNCPCATG
jgi:soluble lytic murein transglycosylase-like protein